MKGLEYFDVIVDRGTTKIPVTVPAYELPVLEAIHNQDTADGLIQMVQVGESRIEPLTEDFDADAAFQALRRKYDSQKDKPTLAVYKNSRDFARSVKLHDIDGRTLKRKPAEPAQATA